MDRFSRFLLRTKKRVKKYRDKRKAKCPGCFNEEKTRRQKANREYFFARYMFHIWMVLFVLQLWEGVHTTLDWIAVFVYPITWITMMPNVKYLKHRYKKK